MEKCSVCGKDALSGILTDSGPMCKVHIFGHMGLPLGEQQEEISCQSCRRLVDRHTACYIQDSGFWHERCLDKSLRDRGRCPKHDIKPSYCGCWGDPIARLVEQAKKDAEEIYEIGDKNRICYMCLKFNAATASGLPFHPHKPQPAEMICSSCFLPICYHHSSTPSKKNILGLSESEHYCNSSYTGGCYQDLVKKVNCSFEDCETIRDEPSPEIWDPLVDSVKCEKCGSFFCDYVSGHSQCPDCQGYTCDGCSDVVSKDYLYPYQEDWHTILKFCEDCLSRREFEDEEQAFDDYFVSDFKSSLEDRFLRFNLDLDLDDVEKSLLEEALRNVMDSCDIYVEHHSDGPSLDVLRAAECIDPLIIINLEGVRVDGYSPKAILPRKALKGIRRLEIEHSAGERAAYIRASWLRASIKKRTPARMTRKRRAALREELRKSMNEPWRWYERGPQERALKHASRTIKGMRAFLGRLSPKERSAYSRALRKERKRPNPFLD